MLTGNFVMLRAIERSDLQKLLNWRNNPKYRQFFREYRELNTENQNNWFENIVLKNSNTVMFSIVELKTNELIGACGLCYIDWVNRNADFSIYIGKDGIYVDNILAIDAAKIMIKYAFEELNLHKLWTEIYDFDKKKKDMFVCLAFKQEGCHRQTHWTNGKWCDSLFYGLINKWHG